MMTVRLRLTGDRALFARPEFATDLVSYDVMTPHAARGALNALHHAPGLRWVIDAIAVLCPIRHETIAQGDRRVAMLRGVDYVVDAHVEDAGGDPAAHYAAFARQMATAPSVYLGHIGCKATATALDPAAPRPPASAIGSGRVDHGWLLHGIAPTGHARYFRAEAVGGVIRVPPDDSPLLFE